MNSDLIKTVLAQCVKALNKTHLLTQLILEIRQKNAWTFLRKVLEEEKGVPLSHPLGGLRFLRLDSAQQALSETETEEEWVRPELPDPSP